MKRFTIVENGYSIDEVNKFIDIVIKRLEKLNSENIMYASKIEELNNKVKMQDNFDSNRLERAILAVQETGDRIKEVSKEEARLIVEEAKSNANAIVHEALIKAEKIELERVNLEKNMRVYKEKMKSLLDSQVKIFDEIYEEDIEK